MEGNVKALVVGAALCGLASVGMTDARASAIAVVNSNSFGLVLFGARTADGTGLMGAATGIQLAHTSTTQVIDEIEVGGGTVNFSVSGGGAGGTVSGSASAPWGGYAFGTLSATFNFTLTNTSANNYEGVTLVLNGRVFNAGGPGIGAQVDDLNYEFSRFSSGQSGGGFFTGAGCDTRAPGAGALVVMTPPTGIACGVQSPDSTVFFFQGVSPLVAGDQKTLSFTLSLLLEASSVPEPAALGLLLLGLAAALVGVKRGRLRQH